MPAVGAAAAAPDRLLVGRAAAAAKRVRSSRPGRYAAGLKDDSTRSLRAIRCPVQRRDIATAVRLLDPADYLRWREQQLFHLALQIADRVPAPASPPAAL